MDVVDQINSNACLNALARVRVSLRDHAITEVEYYNSKEKEDTTNMAAKKNDGTIEPKKPRRSKSTTANEVNAIWQCMAANKIDISYACIGYTLDGKPVLNQDEFVALLSNYGFSMQAALLFIDEFAKKSKDLENGPIVMYSRNIAEMTTDITPIKLD